MPKANRKAVPEKSYSFSERHLDAVEIAIEQIDGLADLINSHYEEIASDSGTLTAVNIIKEKSRWCLAMLRTPLEKQAKGHERP